MLCAVIKGPTLEQVIQELKEAQKSCSLVDFRLDLCDPVDLEQLTNLRKEFPIPMIFNIRSASQGGKFKGSELERLEKIKELISLKPEYVDLGYQVSAKFAHSLKMESPSSLLISSYYNSQGIAPLSQILAELKKTPADLYEIAVTPNSSSECLSLLEFMRQNLPNTLVMALGTYGTITRILSPIFGGLFVHATLDKKVSIIAGRLSAQELLNHYYYPDLSSSTSIYGRISNESEKNSNAIFYNQRMHSMNLSSVYVDFFVSQDDLEAFLNISKKLGIKGLIVSESLGKLIIPFLDHLDGGVRNGSVNALVFKNEIITGYEIKEVANDLAEKKSLTVYENLQLAKQAAGFFELWFKKKYTLNH